MHKIAQQLGVKLTAKAWNIVTAESCTGGLVAKLITDVPGSSHWFGRGFVTYSNEAKQQMLGVRPDTLEKYGAVSEQTVIEMAKGAVLLAGFSIGLAAALVLVGLAVVIGLTKIAAGGRFSSLTAKAPLVSAALVVVSGVAALLFVH